MLIFWVACLNNSKFAAHLRFMKRLIKKVHTPVFLLVLFFSTTLCAFSQNQNDIVSGYIKNLTEIWEANNSKTFENFVVDSSLTLNSEPFKINSTSTKENYKNLLLRSNKIQQSINKKNVGLHATVAYQENFNSPIVDPEEIVVFKRRAIAGIDWDLLNNGFYENRLRNKILKAEYSNLEKKQFVDNLLAFQSKQTEQTIRYFNEKKIQVLDARKSLNDQQTAIIEKLWSIKHITKDNYLKAIQNTTDINAQYNLYKNYNEVALTEKQSFDFELPILDIDVTALFQKANISVTDSIGTANYNDIAKHQSSYIRDVSLKAYTRYNYYDVYNSTLPNRSYLSVGMNLSVPLAFNQKDKKEYYVLQQQITNYKNDDNQQDLQVALLNNYYEYQYKLKQFKNLYHKRLVFLELLRTERVKAQLSDVEFNPNTALFILDDYWSNTIELLDLKQDLYKILISIKSKIPSANITDFTNTLNLSNLNIASSNPPFKAVYVWSDAFKNHSSTIIEEYCRVNEFNPLLISYNPTKIYVNQISEFISKNRATPIHLMIGSNKLLERGLSGYLDTLKTIVNLSQVKGIHLDIEPHTLAGFKENKEAYFNSYVQVLKQAKQFADANKLELSVSIPLSYPESVLEEINKTCRQVYLMAYENIDVDFILRKTEEEKTILKNKCVLALRTKDFENRTQMDEHFKKLGFENTAYHDLDDLIKFDNTSINVKGDGGK